MSLKESLENHPVLIVLGVLLAGFASGVGAMTFLEAREDKLRERIIEELKGDNQKLKTTNEQMDSVVKELVLKHLQQQALLQGKPLGGDNSEAKRIKDEVLRSDTGDIAKAIHDPTKNLCALFGAC